MKVKICGITRVEDGEHALLAGADALGFVFFDKSPRYIPVPRAADIVRQLRTKLGRFKAVGVFVNASMERLKDTADEVGLDFLQLHGDQGLLDCQQVKNELGYNVIQVIRPESVEEVKKRVFDKDIPVLVDAKDADAEGGTGKIANWGAAIAVKDHTRLILAGGINPENVSAAIKEVNPYMLDISSGVESAPGFKDNEKIDKLFEAIENSLEN